MKTNIKKMESVEAIAEFIQGSFKRPIIKMKTKNENQQEEATLLHAISSSLFYFSKNRKNLSIPVCKYKLSDVPNCKKLGLDLIELGDIVGVNLEFIYDEIKEEFSLFLK